MKNMAFRIVDRSFIVAYGSRDPSQEEWTEYIKACEASGFDKSVQLIYTEGGGPNSAQRKFLNDKLAGKEVPVAVMTSSTSVRGVTTALSWFNRSIKSFPANGLSEALAHLGVPSAKSSTYERILSELKEGLKERAGTPKSAGG